MKHESVQRMIATVSEQFPTGRIAEIFANCYGDTIDRTFKREKDGTSFVITGDIPAMWLRDSVCQIRPYLLLCGEDDDLADMTEGLIKKQFQCIQLDPYANAFNETANGMGFQNDKTDMKPYLWERKYEIDSLCFPIQLSYLFWKNSGRTSHFTKQWKATVQKVMEIFRTEQYHESRSGYRFERSGCPFTDTLSRDGMGAQVKDGIGLVWSGFRPSDDACTYGYLIPSNMFLTVVLGYTAVIMREIYQDEQTAAEADDLAGQVKSAIMEYALVPGTGKPYYAYEVDGFGKYLVMDDANVPSLLAMPYMGYCSTDDILYRNTAEVILSANNPYFYKGERLSGIGSPHTPAGYVWDISLAIEGLTASSKEKKLEMIELMTEHDGGTGFMHESINCDDDSDYTREWFSWANALYAELVLDYLGYTVKR